MPKKADLKKEISRLKKEILRLEEYISQGYVAKFDDGTAFGVAGFTGGELPPRRIDIFIEDKDGNTTQFNYVKL